jgi:ABC-2 type transport system ATP-binding protein
MSGAPAPIVAVDGLSKRFAGAAAVDGMSFTVNRGEIFGLVGPDGAGKTTTMRMLAGVMQPDGGGIIIDGVDVVANPENGKQHLSYMPQRFGLYEDLTVDENIRFYADLFEVAKDVREERANRLLAASGMSQFRRRRAGQLSGGMKQKLGLTCALVHTPQILLLDEPTTGVDPVSRRDFWRILYGLREEGVTILITTAYLDEAELKITAKDLKELGIVDEIVAEPEGGAHVDPEGAGQLLGEVLDRQLVALTQQPTKDLLDTRYEKFRKMGQFFDFGS